MSLLGSRISRPLNMSIGNRRNSSWPAEEKLTSYLHRFSNLIRLLNTGKYALQVWQITSFSGVTSQLLYDIRLKQTLNAVRTKVHWMCRAAVGFLWRKSCRCWCSASGDNGDKKQIAAAGGGLAPSWTYSHQQSALRGQHAHKWKVIYSQRCADNLLPSGLLLMCSCEGTRSR